MKAAPEAATQSDSPEFTPVHDAPDVYRDDEGGEPRGCGEPCGSDSEDNSCK